MANYIVCLDSETGGKNPKTSDPLTIFMSLMDNDFKVLAELDLKLKPNDRLPIVEEKAMEVNKIDLQKHLSDPNTITYKEAHKKIVDFVTPYFKATGRAVKITILGQNVGFDLDFIWEHIIDKQSWEKIFSYNVEDTKDVCLFLKRCGWISPECGSLASLVEFFGVPKLTAHEARGDVEMTVQVYKKMIALMESKKNSGNSQDLITLLESE